MNTLQTPVKVHIYNIRGEVAGSIVRASLNKDGSIDFDSPFYIKEDEGGLILKIHSPWNCEITLQ